MRLGCGRLPAVTETATQPSASQSQQRGVSRDEAEAAGSSTARREENTAGLGIGPAYRLKRIGRHQAAQSTEEKMDKGSKKAGAVLLASAVAGLLVLNGATKAYAAEENGTEGKVKCYGANTCKGQGKCAQAGHGCAGKNACKGQGVLETDSKEA
jgi:uncharacterized membrane protein